MRFFLVFPLMVIPVALYNILAVSGSAFSTAAEIRATTGHGLSGHPHDIGLYLANNAGTPADHIIPRHAILRNDKVNRHRSCGRHEPRLFHGAVHYLPRGVS